LQQLVCASNDGPLNGHEVADKFGCRPSSGFWAGLPLIHRNAIGGAQQPCLRAGQILDDSVQSDSDIRSARLFKGMRQLQNAPL
jgi:hypothetical protein